MTAFTRVGSTLWTWEPWISLQSAEARLLWLALYTTGEAKRHTPGLWHGGISVMAEHAALPADVVVSALERLLERELVEYDPKSRVLRLAVLPDPGEFPSNGHCIKSWWRRFNTVPECPVRDAHVTTLRWIVDEGARRRGEALTQHHEEAWRVTFGTVVVPTLRRRGAVSLVNSDTSTQAQPSLFASGNGSASAHDSSYPQNPQPSVDNSAALHQHNKIRSPETVPGTVWGTDRIPDPGSRILDPGSSGEGEGGRGARPVLTLVPPYTAAEVLAEMNQGRWDASFDRSHQDALSAMIPGWVAQRVSLADFAVLREYSVFTGQTMSARWLVGCDMVGEIARARRRLEWRDVQAKAVADSLP